MQPDLQIKVRSRWNGVRKAIVALADLSGFHFSKLGGETFLRSPRPFLYAFVPCNTPHRGGLTRSCGIGPHPHMLKVCVLQKDNQSRNYAAALAQCRNKL